jgi:hypothetical protein
MRVQDWQKKTATMRKIYKYFILLKQWQDFSYDMK